MVRVSMRWLETQELIAQKAAALRRLYADILAPPTAFARGRLLPSQDLRIPWVDHLVQHESENAWAFRDCEFLWAIKEALPEQRTNIE